MSTLTTTELMNNGRVKCPSCGCDVLCNDTANSTYFCCVMCDTYFKKEGDKVAEKIDVFPRNLIYQPLLPLGSKCTFDGREFFVAGFVVKKDNASGVVWREYLLRCEGQTWYTTLAEFNGHWSIIDQVERDNYKCYRNRYDGTFSVWQSEPFKKFKQYTSYRYRIEALRGEFDWDIGDEQEHMFVEEYINPPEMITMESYRDTDVTWYKGRYLERTELAAGFNINVDDVPRSSGLGAIQVHPLDNQWPAIRTLSLLMVGLIFLTQIMLGLARPSKVVLNEAYTTTADTGAWGGNYAPIRTGSFQIKQSGPVNINVRADVSNEWMEIPVSMVNERTGKEYEFTKVAESYFGYEDGESWSEGSSEIEAVFSAVPAGTYHINMYPYSESKKEHNISINVESNTTLYSNMWWLLLLVSGYWFIQYQRKVLVDTERFS
ncbi:MAG: DUF4178 domain-containing protein [Chitinophagaceae bacterium]|nr:DUF4178 domain-containing protein [Chitinophagaceae bacterium]